jgi:hypothetical protein
MQPESHERWLERQAIELLAQHIPFEADLSVKAECIEELRGLALRSGRHIDRALFGFEARMELQRLRLWDYFTDSRPLSEQQGDDDITYGHGRSFHLPAPDEDD